MILPFSCIVGQERVKLALQLAYIEPRLGGVLLSGHRGTAKSTAVRAFSLMVWKRLPTTLPINATEDRVVGGWKIETLLQGKDEWQPGVLEEADQSMLYIDEVNLLDDHIVNLILDAASTNLLIVQREASRKPMPVHFSLVGTMNPEEGGLRPQLLDRFGLVVTVEGEKTSDQRKEILRKRLQFDDQDVALLDEALKTEKEICQKLEKARAEAGQLTMHDNIADLCIKLAEEFKVEGHRAELTLALAARAHAALQGRKRPMAEDVIAVAGMALAHRRKDLASDRITWSEADEARVKGICK